MQYIQRFRQRRLEEVVKDNQVYPVKLDNELTLKINNMIISYWYAYAAFEVHSDMKSHVGGVLTMGKGEIQTISMNQKLNTKRSTKAELVAANYV